MLIVTGSFLVITVVERHDKRLLWIATGSWGAVNRKNMWRLGYRWSPEVSHILDFSFIELNKTVLNNSRKSKFDETKGETLTRVWEREKDENDSVM